jgi:predicted aspartyl protease
MKNTSFAGFAVRTALFCLTLAGFCQGAFAQSEIRFRLVHDTIIVVSLMANETGPFDFVLDTGTDTTIVDPLLARQLSLAALDRIQLTTLGGSQTLTRSLLRVLAAGQARVGNLEVLVQDLGEVRQLDSRILGMVGQNFLSHFNYLLDYRKRSLRVELADEIRDDMKGDRISMEVTDNKMMVTSEAQSLGRAKLRLLLDSGANSMVLIQKDSRALNLSGQANWVEVTGTGQVGMQVGRVRSLMVGSQQFHDIAVALPPAVPSDAERVEDGLLPTAMFGALYVNNRESFVVFNPRMKKN